MNTFILFNGDKFLVRDKLGKGSYASVYKMVGEGGEEFAVKLNKEKIDAMHEYTISTKVNHPNVVKYEKSETKFGKHTLFYLRAPIFEQCFRFKRSYTRANIIKMTESFLRGLVAFHSAGYVHLDLSSANVMGNNFEMCLIDFSIAKPIGARCEWFANDIGMPEDEDVSVVDPKMDVYRAGLLLRRLWEGTDGYQFVKELIDGMTQTSRDKRLASSDLMEIWMKAKERLESESDDIIIRLGKELYPDAYKVQPECNEFDPIDVRDIKHMYKHNDLKALYLLFDSKVINRAVWAYMVRRMMDRIMIKRGEEASEAAFILFEFLIKTKSVWSGEQYKKFHGMMKQKVVEFKQQYQKYKTIRKNVERWMIEFGVDLVDVRITMDSVGPQFSIVVQ